MKTQRIQTKEAHGFFGLPVLQASPYFSIGRGALVQIPVMTLKCFILSYNVANPGISIDLKASDGSIDATANVPLTITYSDTDATIKASVQTAISNYCVNIFGIQAPDLFVWDSVTPTDLAAAIAAAIPAAPSSYQTIVSQTGTAAPAVSGSLSPASTYPSGTTFMWARTGAGVYTLTASTAVFNTSGKTGVFVGSLNNLNASCKTVVTSSTVITITTAIGSLLGLGLLGLTATNTDALLSQTMIYVQTYA